MNVNKTVSESQIRQKLEKTETFLLSIFDIPTYVNFQNTQ